MCCLGQVIDTPVLAELAWTVAADLKEMGLLGEEVLCFLFCVRHVFSPVIYCTPY